MVMDVSYYKRVVMKTIANFTYESLPENPLKEDTKYHKAKDADGDYKGRSNVNARLKKSPKNYVMY